MKRIAFTIIYNGLHHLTHKGFTEFMLENFDHWVIVEGHSRPNGSTNWCNKLQVPVRSTDGTHEYLTQLALENSNVTYYSPNRYWMSKDTQVNKAVEIIRGITPKCFLWQVDADEHWTSEKLTDAELVALDLPYTGFSFQFNHFIGHNMIAHGDWGGGVMNRLWKWDGLPFKTHEPALLVNQRSCCFIPDIKFDHYSYYFETDVKFKSEYYKDHHDVYLNWLQLNNIISFPAHISKLFGENSKIGKSNSYIYEISNN